MIAVVLVGGEATRLRPLTWRTPKALVPVLNRPFLEHVLDHLRRHGIDDVVLAIAGATNEQIRGRLGDGSSLGLRLRYSVETHPLGSGGAFKLLEKDLASGTFLVLNGDIYADLDLAAMLVEHRRRGAVCSIALTEVEDPTGFGVVAMTEDGRITRFVEKPRREEAPSRWINAGTWAFEPAVLPVIPPDTFTMVERDLFPGLVERGEMVYGFRSQAYWVDIGTPERYRRLNMDLLQDGDGVGRARVVLGDGSSVHPTAEVRGRLLVGKGCRIGAGVLLLGGVVLGDGCEVETGAVIEDSVLWDGVRVGRAARVSRSILAGGARVADGCEARDAVIAHGAKVEAPGLAAGSRLEPDCVWDGKSIVPLASSSS